MKKSAGKIRLLHVLLGRLEPMMTGELAKEVGKSERSVRTYLDELQLEYPDLRLMRRSKTGIWLEADAAIKEKYSGMLRRRGEHAAHLPPDRRQRQWHILKTLFLERHTYTIQLFADELFCSKSAIVQDLAAVEKWLLARQIKLHRRKNLGIWLEGEEKDLRLAFKVILDETRPGNPCETDPPIEDLDYRINIINYNRIRKILPKINLFLIQKVVQETEQELFFYFTEQAFQNLVVHLAIAVRRIGEHKILEQFQAAEELKNTSEYAAATHMIEKLEQGLQMRFPETEAAYAAMHILGAKVQVDESDFNVENLLIHYGEEEMSLANEVIRIASAVLQVDLAGDKKLLIRLIQHLRPTIVRMKQGLSLINPMLLSIKREYPAAFAAAWATNSAFERIVGLPLSEDEVAYIVLHLIAGAEECQRKVKAIVVCASGIGTSRLIANKLERAFPNMEMIGLLSYNKLSPELEAQADIIISTVRVLQGKKIVYVSVLLTEEDKEKIRRYLERISLPKYEETKRENSETSAAKLSAEAAAGTFIPAYCFLEDESSDFDTLLQKYGNMLEEEGFAKPGFTEDMLHREKIGSTYIGHGISIPHARDSFVLQSRIVFIRLRQPILVQQESVGIVLLLCLKFSEARSTVHFFKNFYAVLSDETAVQLLYRENAPEKIAGILNCGGKENG